MFLSALSTTSCTETTIENPQKCILHFQTAVGKMLMSGPGQIAVQWISIRETNCTNQWIYIYPVDSSGGHPDPEIRVGGAVSQKKPRSKNKGGPGPGPHPQIPHWIALSTFCNGVYLTADVNLAVLSVRSSPMDSSLLSSIPCSKNRMMFCCY